MNTQEHPINTLAMSSMIIGISSFFMFLYPPLQFILGVVSILLAIFSKKEKPLCGFAIAGTVLSLISMLMSFALVWLSHEILQNPDFAPILDLMSQMYKDMYGSVPIP